MNTRESTVKLALPNRIFKHGTEPVGLERINMCSSLKLVGLVKDLLGSDFEKLEKSFLSTIIKLGQDKTVTFSGKLVHYLLQRRIITKEEELWFTFGEQPMRFSLREFFLTTGLPCSVVGGTSNKKGDRKKKTYSWMKDGIKLKELIRILTNRKGTMKPDEKVRIGALILVEGILLAQHADLKIPVVRLLRAKDFEEYCSYPWGKCAYDTLVKSVVKLTSNHLSRKQYWFHGFPLAIQFWALSSVHQLGTRFAKRVVSTTNGPLCLEWTHTSTPQLREVARIAELDKVKKLGFYLHTVLLISM